MVLKTIFRKANLLIVFNRARLVSPLLTPLKLTRTAPNCQSYMIKYQLIKVSVSKGIDYRSTLVLREAR